jgi:hypothetical protein
VVLGCILDYALMIAAGILDILKALLDLSIIYFKICVFLLLFITIIWQLI